MYGVDAAESYGKNRSEKGQKAKEFCIKLLQGKYFTLISKEKKGKYGRLIADILLFDNKGLLSDFLVTNNYAKYVKYWIKKNHFIIFFKN